MQFELKIFNLIKFSKWGSGGGRGLVYPSINLFCYVNTIFVDILFWQGRISREYLAGTEELTVRALSKSYADIKLEIRTCKPIEINVKNKRNKNEYDRRYIGY